MSFVLHKKGVNVLCELSGYSLDELFVSAGEAFSSVLVSPVCVVPHESHSLHFEAHSLDVLLNAFFDELLWLKDSDGFVTRDVEVVVTYRRKFFLDVVLHGESLDVHRHDLRRNILGVTFLPTYFGSSGNTYRLTFLFDVH